MGSDAIVNGRVCSSNYKNSSKKKRGNKHGKSKQNKVDVTREQRLVRVENKCNAEKNNGCVEKTSNMEKIEGNCNEGVGGRNHENETRITRYKNETESRTRNGLIVRRLYDNKDEVCWLSSSSCSDGSDDRCFDDWEAAADALTPQNDTHISQINNKSYVVNTRAWTLNDVYRPRNLPALGYTQHHLNSSNSEHCFSSACPICCEDFDVTDLSFLPCPCGFQLCLFCHQRILEVDSRCPGCRHQYDSISVKADAALPDETNTWI